MEENTQLTNQRTALDNDRFSCRILLALYQYFPFGGLQKDTLRIAKEACHRGHDVTIFTTSWNGLRPEGIRLLFCECAAWTNAGRMEKFAKSLQEEVASGKYDAVLAMNRIPGGDFYFVADSCMAEWMPRRHCRLVRALVPRYRTYLRHEAEICAQNGGSILMYIAETQKVSYQKFYGLPDSRFAYLPPGMDSRCIRPADAEVRRQAKRRELGLTEQDVMVLQVGTNLWRKGVDRSMQALTMQTRKEEKILFFLAGGDTEASVQKLARKNGLPDTQLRFLGPRNDVPELLLAADLMVHPAREEGTGTVLVESIAAGCPVLCTSVCGFSPFVQEATQTVQPEPFDAMHFSEMLAYAILHREKLAQRTREYAATQDFCSRSRVAVDILEKFAAENSMKN